MFRIFVYFACMCVALTMPSSALADRGNIAESLFREGKALYAEGKIAAACAKFEESFRVDAANGTLQNWATCVERQGKLASAWALWIQLESRATRAQQAERVKLARSKLEELAPQLARVRLHVPSTSAVHEVVVDGVVLLNAAWTTPLTLDPGEHRLEFRAPDRVSETLTVSLRKGGVQTVEAPTLRPAPQIRRTLGYVLGAVGIVGVGVGAGFGVRAMVLDGDSQDAAERANASRDRRAYDEGRQMHESAVTSQLVGIVAGATGLVALGAGVGLVVSTKRARASDQSSRRTLRVRVQVAGGGLGVVGQW